MSHTTPHSTADLVISCIDYRFRPLVAAWIKKEFNDTADLVAGAGAGKSLLDPVSRDYILGQIKIGVALHGVKTVHLVQHLDCGAYGGSGKQTDAAAEQAFHATESAKAALVIQRAYPTLAVKTYFATFAGVEEQPAPALIYADPR